LQCRKIIGNAVNCALEQALAIDCSPATGLSRGAGTKKIVRRTGRFPRVAAFHRPAGVSRAVIMRDIKRKQFMRHCPGHTQADVLQWRGRAKYDNNFM
jgi:hypothetical protein